MDEILVTPDQLDEIEYEQLLPDIDQSDYSDEVVKEAVKTRINRLRYGIELLEEELESEERLKMEVRLDRLEMRVSDAESEEMQMILEKLSELNDQIESTDFQDKSRKQWVEHRKG